MIKYVAFLRGINVGGSKLIKMADLREVFTAAGCRDVSTYIQSGNVIFTAKETDADALARKIEKKIRQSMGQEVRVIVLTAAELKSCVGGDPFGRIQFNEDAVGFVTFLAADPIKWPRLPLVIAKENVEVLALRKRAAFIVCRRKPNGTFGFPNAFLEKELGVAATTRNVRTVMKMIELVESAPVD